MALVDVGVAALKASGNPSSKQEVVKAISKLRLTTTMGELDWTKGPVPNYVSTPITGIQCGQVVVQRSQRIRWMLNPSANN
jgi:branched-chain amino acid transport system substrate-binding protein